MNALDQYTTINNYTLREFSQEPDETKERYNNILHYLKPVETVNKIFYLSLEQVENIKDALRTGKEDKILESVKVVQGFKKDKEVYNMTIIDLFGVINSIKQQVEKILKLEEQSLTPKYPNVKWNLVKGSEKMAKFGIINTLDDLSNNDITKYDAILAMPYNRVFGVLYKRTVKADIDIEMSKIKD